MTLAIQPHLRYALVGKDIILLDLKANRYVAVPRERTTSFRKMLEGASLDSVDRQTLAPYVSRGILMVDCGHRPTSPAAIAKLAALDIGRIAPTLEMQLRAAVGRYRARLELRYSPFSSVLERLAALKQKSPQDGPIEELRRVASAFHATYHLLARHDRCLPIAIAVFRECLRQRLGVELVLGVQTNPFNAHAWIQMDDLVVNDDPSFVATFTPILAV